MTQGSSGAATASAAPAVPSGAVVLLSGGLDSATVLAMARAATRPLTGARCIALTIDYGQRHRHELQAAATMAHALRVDEHVVLSLDMRSIGGSALTSAIDVPKHDDREQPPNPGKPSAAIETIPVTYVPARNLIFLSLAIALAEARGCGSVWIGVNAVDYSGYPDCRPEFIAAFARAANLATREGVIVSAQGAGRPAFRIETPIIGLTKAQIIRAGIEHGLDYGLTHSCYDPATDGRACGRCDSCVLRARGFREAGIADPTRYAGD